jgi:hypothetical protein
VLLRSLTKVLEYALTASLGVAVALVRSRTSVYTVGNGSASERPGTNASARVLD